MVTHIQSIVHTDQTRGVVVYSDTVHQAYDLERVRTIVCHRVPYKASPVCDLLRGSSWPSANTDPIVTARKARRSLNLDKPCDSYVLLGDEVFTTGEVKRLIINNRSMLRTRFTYQHRNKIVNGLTGMLWLLAGFMFVVTSVYLSQQFAEGGAKSFFGTAAIMTAATSLTALSVYGYWWDLYKGYSTNKRDVAVRGAVYLLIALGGVWVLIALLGEFSPPPPLAPLQLPTT